MRGYAKAVVLAGFLAFAVLAAFAMKMGDISPMAVDALDFTYRGLPSPTSSLYSLAPLPLFRQGGDVAIAGDGGTNPGQAQVDDLATFILPVNAPRIRGVHSITVTWEFDSVSAADPPYVTVALKKFLYQTQSLTVVSGDGKTHSVGSDGTWFTDTISLSGTMDIDRSGAYWVYLQFHEVAAGHLAAVTLVYSD